MPATMISRHGHKSWFWGVLSFGCLLPLGPVTLGQTDPLQEFDILESYTVSNRHQCQRLCWYRARCTRYSFYTKDDKPGENWDNCVLHFHGWGQPVMEGWVEATASVEGMPEDHACLSTPCSGNEMCIPVRTNISFICINMAEACKNFRNQYRLYNNLRWTGGTLWILEGTDLQTCKDHCDDSPECSSFVRVNGVQPSCVLKRDPPRDITLEERQFDMNADTYAKSCA